MPQISQTNILYQAKTSLKKTADSSINLRNQYKLWQKYFCSKVISYKIFILLLFILSSCRESGIPGELQGTYNGRERVVIRYDKGGQYIYFDDYVMVSLLIDKSGEVIGMAGDAVLESCSVKQNRGWISRQLGIKTDFLIQGTLKGNIFEKDTILNKSISIPFNIENGELKGSLNLTTKGDSYPVISILKLQKSKK